jgi:cytochrome P450
MYAATRKIIDARIESRASGQPKILKKRKDLLDIYLDLHDQGDYPIDNLMADFLSFVVGGRDTTMKTLETLFYYASKNPAVIQKI